LGWRGPGPLFARIRIGVGLGRPVIVEVLVRIRLSMRRYIGSIFAGVAMYGMAAGTTTGTRAAMAGAM
jgi:hypothetical protein